MKTCYGYVRVSTIKQGEGVSLEAQKDAISTFASHNQAEIIEWFEETETAAKSGRPRFNAMVSNLRKRRADGVIFHKIDRSARNFADWAKIGDLIDGGVDVRFAHEDVDLTSRGGRLTADIQAVVAADYVRNLRHEIHKGIRGRLNQGLLPRQAPIGYLDSGSGKAKTPDPERAPLIKQLFTLYASGNHSYKSLLAEMRQRGLTNRKGGVLTMHGLETILQNQFYCGIIKLKRTGETFEGIHEPLISVDLFQRAQAAKDGRCGKKITKHNNLFRGLFRCGLCRRLLIPELQKGHCYYRCKQSDCETKTIREDALDAALRESLATLTLEKDDVETALPIIEGWISDRKDGLVNRSLSMQVAAEHEKLDRLTDALIDRLIDKATFQERKATIELNLARYREQERANADLAKKAAWIREVAELACGLANAYDLGNPAEKRELVKIAWPNRTVIRKKVCLEPSKWVRDVRKLVALTCGDALRDKNRTDPLDKLIKNFTPPTKVQKALKRRRAKKALHRDDRTGRWSAGSASNSDSRL